MVLDCREGFRSLVKLGAGVQVVPQVCHQGGTVDLPQSEARNLVGMPPCQMAAVVLAPLPPSARRRVAQLIEWFWVEDV